MANLKKEIDDRLIVEPLMLQLFEAATLFDDKIRKYVKTKAEKIKVDSVYDVDEYTVTYISDVEIEKHIHIRAIIDSVLKMEGGSLRKAIYNDTTIIEGDGIYTADVRFTLIHNWEKE